MRQIANVAFSHQLTTTRVSHAPGGACVACCDACLVLQVEQTLRQQLDVRMKALAEADQRFAHMEGVMRRLAESAAPRTRTSPDGLKET